MRRPDVSVVSVPSNGKGKVIEIKVKEAYVNNVKTFWVLLVTYFTMFFYSLNYLKYGTTNCTSLVSILVFGSSSRLPSLL